MTEHNKLKFYFNKGTPMSMPFIGVFTLWFREKHNINDLSFDDNIKKIFDYEYDWINKEISKMNSNNKFTSTIYDHYMNNK